LTSPHVVVVGSNHAYAPVAIREQLAFSGESLTDGLQVLQSRVSEGMILSTCNRTEIYAVDEGDGCAREAIFGFLASYHHVPMSVLEHASYSESGDAAVRHLFRVASGLDSLVLGEPQILSQIRDALDTAREAGSLGPILQRLATEALRAGKRARTETDIARNRVSIAHAAIDLAVRELGGLRGASVLILGAGKMADLTARLLNPHTPGEVLIVNRSLARAQELASRVGARAVPQSGLGQALARADVVIGAVTVDEPMITPDLVRPRSAPRLLIDISVPRSIDPACESISSVLVRDVDALEPFAAETRRQYADEVSKVEHLVELSVAEFGAWTRSRNGAKAIAMLHQRGHQIRETEVERTLRKLDHLSERDQNLVRALAHAVTQKLLHHPTLALRHAESRDTTEAILDALGIDHEPHAG
jgi:glutamyl-tRNA reductase